MSHSLTSPSVSSTLDWRRSTLRLTASGLADRVLAMPVPVILDTDIGTDVDDCLALGLLLGSPELDPFGITCVYGDVELRARMVHRLLDLGGRPDVPVRLGARQPLLGRRPVYWAGHEGEGLLENAPAPTLSDEDAVDFL